MTIEKNYKELLNLLHGIYNKNEAACIADMAFEFVTGYSKSNRILHKQEILNEYQQKKIKEISSELSTQKPIQYVLKEAWFCNKKFFVNEHVLIPRQETEELVQLIASNNLNNKSIIDIGTGSGCIPITLKNKFSNSNITAIDVSKDALEVAKKNAQTFDTEINLLQLNFLDEKNWELLNNYDFIISNPPYVKKSESSTMQKNVLSFEPHTALFVPDDALIFYKKIALFAKKHLNNNGKIFVEINETLGKKTKQLFEQYRYLVKIIKDMQGKDRFLECVKDIY
ncbi:MAG: peptide chain release factor N(5)-glutamine methyltransferase [Chitinophagales bacterium]|nr:peptide chain release factor N(5)-glutamine methyltransferase [Chitinophagales bacterium]